MNSYNDNKDINNIDKDMDELIHSAFDELKPEELDDATLNAYLSASNMTLSSKIRRAGKGLVAVAACVCLVFVGGRFVKNSFTDKDSNTNASQTEDDKGNSVVATKPADTTDDNKDNDSTNDNKDNDSTNDSNTNDDKDNNQEETVITLYDSAWQEFLGDKIVLMVMNPTVTELGVVGYQCVFVGDSSISREGALANLIFPEAVDISNPEDNYYVSLPPFLNEETDEPIEYRQPLQVGDVIAIDMPDAVDSALPVPIYVNKTTNLYKIDYSNDLPLKDSYDNYFSCLEGFLYEPTTLSYSSSMFGVTGFNQYSNKSELDKLIEIVNSGEGIPYHITIVEKDFTFSQLTEDWFTDPEADNESINLCRNVIKTLCDNNYGISTYYDVLYDGTSFVVRVDATEHNNDITRRYASIPYTKTFKYLHVVEDYAGTNSLFVYLSNDEESITADEVDLFLSRYYTTTDSSNVPVDNLVLVQSHLGVKGLRSLDDSNNNDQSDEDNKPENVYYSHLANIDYMDNTNREIAENHLEDGKELKDFAREDKIVSIDEAIKTAQELKGAVKLHKDTNKVVLYDIVLGYASDIGEDYVKTNWGNEIVYKIIGTCYDKDMQLGDAVFYVKAIRPEITYDKNENSLDSNYPCTLPPDESEFRSEDEFVKGIKAGKKEELKNIPHYYMPQSIPKNWYLDRIYVDPSCVTVRYKYVKDNEVKNIGDYTLSWHRENEKGEELTCTIIGLSDDSYKQISWNEESYNFYAKVPMDAGMNEIRDFCTLNKNVIE